MYYLREATAPSGVVVRLIKEPGTKYRIVVNDKLVDVYNKQVPAYDRFRSQCLRRSIPESEIPKR